MYVYMCVCVVRMCVHMCMGVHTFVYVCMCGGVGGLHASPYVVAMVTLCSWSFTAFLCPGVPQGAGQLS